jgi:hypothetical protein
MSANSSLDRESFQKLLASAFAVQESRMDRQSLSAMIQIQRLIAAGGLDLDAAIHVIAGHTRDVADASGVAIALLQGHQLVYRAANGTAAPYVGRHMAATLSVAADNQGGREILRVENAHNDPRIEAAICRQFGAESLLIMPIYRDQVVTGVLEVMFREAHAFQDGEVRAYRMMTGLVGEALTRAARAEEKKAVPADVSAPLIVEQTMVEQTMAEHTMAEHPLPPQGEVYCDDAGPENKHAIYRLCAAAMAAAGDLSASWRLPGAAVMISDRIGRLPLRTPQWSAAAAALMALVVIGWSAYSGHHHGQRQKLTVTDQRLSAPADPSLKNNAARGEISRGETKATNTPKSTFKRIRVGKNEIDYVADDVTVRYFAPRPTTEAVRAYNRVEFGNDVTVRYFASDPAIVRPVASVARPINRSLPVPEKPITPRLAR